MQRFDVNGMSCQHCVSAVTAAVARVDPAASVEVDLKTGRLVVNNETAPEDVLLQAIAAEGYEALPASS